MKTVLFSHGFGVMKDARGMFTEIAEALEKEGARTVFVDLNSRDAEGNILLNTLHEQAEILKESAKNIEGELHLICHSQGCVVASLANIPNAIQTIFLAPQIESDYTKSVEYFSKNPLSKINLEGISKLKRRDGTFTFVPSEYWKERKDMNLKSLYEGYIANHKVVVVKALNDEVVSSENLSDILTNTEILEVDTNHDFTDKREELVSLCCNQII